MADELIFTQIDARDLTPAGRAEIIRLCTFAYAEGFSDFFEVLPNSTHILARLEGELVSYAAWATRWLQPEGGPMLTTAFVEAVATAPAHRGKGFASAVLREVANRITNGVLNPDFPFVVFVMVRRRSIRSRPT